MFTIGDGLCVALKRDYMDVYPCGENAVPGTTYCRPHLNEHVANLQQARAHARATLDQIDVKLTEYTRAMDAADLPLLARTR